MSSLKIILLGFLRHTLTAFGMWLVTRGYIEEGSRSAWTDHAVQEAFGAVLVACSYFWSAFDKRLVIEWLRKALHMQPPSSEKAAAKRISNLVTAPGTTAVPPSGAATLLFCASVVVMSITLPLAMSCSSGSFVIPISDGSHATDTTTTVYRNATSARTVLTALETLRYHAAELVGKAYIAGRITKAQADEYARYDDDFRTSWATASDLVHLWLVSKNAPPQVQAAMNLAEKQATKLIGLSESVR